jgi:hypothetical protein
MGKGKVAPAPVISAAIAEPMAMQVKTVAATVLSIVRLKFIKVLVAVVKRQNAL